MKAKAKKPTVVKPKKPKLTREEKARREEAIRNFIGKCLLFLTVSLICAIPFVVFYLFREYYFFRNDLFLVTPDKINITGNTTLKRDIILTNFDLHNRAVNGFEVVRNDTTERLRTYLPTLKNAEMTYIPLKGIDIWVEERTPLARLDDTNPPLTVDEEGVIFNVPPSTSKGYPVIGGFDVTSDMQTPGKELRAPLHCILSLLALEQFAENKLPSRITSVKLLGETPEDGLRVALADGRRITIAWPFMEQMARLNAEKVVALRALSEEFAELRQVKEAALRTSTHSDDRIAEERIQAWEKRVRAEGSSPELIRRLQHLRIALSASIAEGRKHFNATTERITASE